MGYHFWRKLSLHKTEYGATASRIVSRTPCSSHLRKSRSGVGLHCFWGSTGSLNSCRGGRILTLPASLRNPLWFISGALSRSIFMVGVPDPACICTIAFYASQEQGLDDFYQLASQSKCYQRCILPDVELHYYLVVNTPYSPLWPRLQAFLFFGNRNSQWVSPKGFKVVKPYQARGSRDKQALANSLLNLN